VRTTIGLNVIAVRKRKLFRFGVGGFALLSQLVVCNACSELPTTPSRVDLGGGAHASAGDVTGLVSQDALIASLGTPDSLTATVVTIAATAPTAREDGPVSGAFTVTRTGDTSAALIVNYKVGGTAKTGSDYGALAGSVVIKALQSSEVITLTPVADGSYENCSESVRVTLITGIGYTLGTPRTATVTIVADQPPLVGWYFKRNCTV
jgi:hypothetical protein